MKQRLSNSTRILKSALMCLCLVASSLSVLFVGQVSASVPAQPTSPNSPNGLVINEAFDSATIANEYFELYNTSNTTINLSTYEVYNRDSKVALSNLADSAIRPGEFRGIGPSQLHTTWFTSTGGLDQDDFLGLVNTSPSDTVIDVVNWGSAPSLGWSNYERFRDYFFTSDIPDMPAADDRLSLQRWPDGLDTDQGTDWKQILRSPGAASCADPYEGRDNDNDPARAPTHQVGASNVYLHRLCPASDIDYFAISLTANVTYTIRITPTSGSQVNPVLRLFDTGGGQVAEDTDTSNNTATIRFRPTSNATFRAQVTNATSNGAPGPTWLYNANITASGDTPGASATPTIGGCTDPYEPDDQLGQARGISLNSEQTHLLCKPGGAADTDWVAVAASSGKVYSFITKNLSGPVDTIISLHLSDGFKLAENDDATPGQGLGSRIDYTFGGTGTYFIRIRDKSGASGPGHQYTFSFESTGQLPPTATASPSPTANPFSPTPTPGQCFDAYEPDGVPETAKLMYIASTQKHSICPVGDADWIRFYARPGKVYTIRTLNLGVGVDTYMWIFDADGKMLGYDDDGGGEGVSSRIDFYPLADGFYFVQIKNAGDLGGTEQTYDVSLAVAAGVPQPPGTATFIVAPVVTVTADGGEPTVVVQPTQQTAPTNPPLPSPTRESNPPTPAAEEPVQPTQIIPPAQSTEQATVGVPPSTVTPEIVEEPTAEEPDSVTVPGIPRTGDPDTAVIVLPTTVTQRAPNIIAQPDQNQPQQLGTDYAPMLFRVFYDRNLNDLFDTGEGIRGLNIYFVGKDARQIALGSLVTEENGTGRTTLPTSEQRIVIPYLGIDMPLNRFPERELHSIWLPKISLPEQVP